jgi:N-acetylmuramoyl-L-alanine amidase
MLILPSPNWNDRPTGAVVDMLILHYTGMRDAASALARLRDPAASVSAHYVIEEDGAVWQLVDETRRAWHAGVSAWAGRTSLNDVSIGIELVNPGHEFGYRPFAEPQIEACIDLCRAILARWPIPAGRVLAHSDVAPTRKEDPGELFPWPRLAAAGVGLLPEASADGGPPPLAEVQGALGRFGYGLPPSGVEDEATRAVVRAFQRHFVPDRLGQPFDALAWARLRALVRPTR